MLHIINNYKKLFVSFVKNDLTGGLEGNSSTDSQKPDEQINISDILKKIGEDGKVNGEDLYHIQSLEQAFSSEKGEIYKNTREGLLDIIKNMLKDGFSVGNENDFDALKKIISITNNKDIKLPNYNDIVSNLPKNNNDFFSLVLCGDKMLVYTKELYMKKNTVNTDEAGYIDLNNGTFHDKTWIKEFLFSFDDITTNNNLADFSSLGHAELVDLKNHYDTLEILSIEEYATSTLIPKKIDFDVPSEESDLVRLKNSIVDIEKWNKFVIDYEIAKLAEQELAEQELAKEMEQELAESETESKVEPKETVGIKPIEETKETVGIKPIEETKDSIVTKDASVSEVSKPKTAVESKPKLSEKTPEQVQFDKAKSFYERMGATNSSIVSLQASLLLNGEDLPKYKADGSFGKETFDAIKSFQKKNGLVADGMAGEKTLKALGSLKEGENTKDFYTSANVGNKEIESDKVPPVVTAENGEVKLTEKEEKSNSLIEKFNCIKQFIVDIFKSNPTLAEFKGLNGENIKLEYRERDNTIHVNTPFFDGISDFPLNDIPKDIDTIEEATVYVKSKLNDIKQKYDEQVLDNAIKNVTRVRGNNDNRNVYSSSVDNFEVKNKSIDIKLQSKYYGNGKHKGYFIKVDTPIGDKISDKEVTLKIQNPEDKVEIRSKSEELKEKYKKMFDERNKEVKK